MSKIYAYEHQVLDTEVEPEGNANCLAYLNWTRYAAIAHSTAQDWPPERYRDIEAAWVVRSHEIHYRQPAFVDEDVIIETWVVCFDKAKSTRKYRIIRPSNDALLVVAQTHWTLIDTKTRRPRRVPPELINAFSLLPESDEPEMGPLAVEHQSV